MLIKIIIGALLIFIIVNLVRAGLTIMKESDPTVSMSHFLGKRVLYSVIALVLIILAVATGLIAPNDRPY